MRHQYCQPCGEEGHPVDASEEIDGVPMCYGHAVQERRRAKTEETATVLDPGTGPASDPQLCKRGCGRPTHRGNCPRPEGVGAQAAPANGSPQSQQRGKAEPAADPDETLQVVGGVRVVRLSDVPQRIIGIPNRLDALLGHVLSCDEGFAVETLYRSRRAAGNTVKEMKRKAKAAGIAIEGCARAEKAFFWRKARPAA